MTVFMPTLTNFAAIGRPAFGRAAQHQADAAPPAKRTKAQARYMRAAKTAAELLPELPARGESVHCLMLGSYDLMQVVAATVKLVPTCRHLRIATLCFSKRNTAEMLGLLETYPKLRLTLLVSAFFKSHNADLYENFAQDLEEFTGRAKMAAARSHCKVVCFDLAEGDGLTFEGSANLRTNRNREQLCVIRDRGLHDWHSQWTDGLVSAHDGEEEARKTEK
ncbi:MAG TPA: hypothetical protein VN641_10005 [Urbifossiella sp.]|nr:hypothetical protein [Urbifossiella sp.]